MEAAAEPGTVLITQDTHRLVAPLFEAESLGPIEVKGKAEPVSVYRVLAPKAVAGKPRGIAGLESPLVGREAELAALEEALKQLQAGVGGIVTVVGEAGIGKSRLVAELRKAAAPSGVRWVEGRCLSYGESIAYLPWVEALHGLVGMSVEDPPLMVRDALRRWVEALCPGHVDAVYPYLGHMMSLPLEDEIEARLRGLEPQGVKVLTFRAMERVVRSAGHEEPLVLVCEDLHWADPSSLELLEHLLPLTEQVSLLLICAFRPYRDHGCWGIRETASRLYDHRNTDMRLSPLSTADSEELVSHLLEVEALPRPLRGRILDHAEGNPFYVEEVIRSLIDSGVIVYDETTEQWQATQRVEDIAIPDTLQGVLMARIDRLQEEARRVLQMASVIGRIFPYRVLAAIAQEREHPEQARPEQGRRSRRGLDAHLLTLQREEMIRQRARVPEMEYIFKHHLTQEAAYNGLLRRDRRRFHRQVAEALERLFLDRIGEQLGFLAYHWDRAEEQEKAVHYLRRAGEQAAAQYASMEAVNYFSRALDLTPGRDLAGRYTLLLARERVYDLQAAREDQQRDLGVLESLANDLDDDRRRAEVALRQAWYGIVTGNYLGGIEAAQRGVRLAQAAQDARTEVSGYLLWGQALWDQGDYQLSRTQLEQALSLATAVQLRQVQADSRWGLSYVRLYQGDYDGARAYAQQALNIYRELGDRRGEGQALETLAMAAGWGQWDYSEGRDRSVENLRVRQEIGDHLNCGFGLLLVGANFHMLGAYDKAWQHYRQALPILQETGHVRGEGNALGNMALLSHHLGDDRSALEYAQRALLAVQDAADRFMQALALTVRGHALLGLGRPDQAVDAYREALSLRRQLGLHYLANEPLAGLARTAIAQGDVPQAERHVEEILNYLESGTLQGTWEPFRVYLTCYRVLQTADDPRAGEILETAHRLLQESADRISDEEERRSFLENVAAHREIASEYARGEYSLVKERSDRK